MLTRHQRAGNCGRAFDMLAAPTCITVLAAAAAMLAVDMIATGAETASTSPALGPEAAAHYEPPRHP